jgi:hypothetical protein
MAMTTTVGFLVELCDLSKNCREYNDCEVLFSFDAQHKSWHLCPNDHTTLYPLPAKHISNRMNRGQVDLVC